jgi:hypothetical protein
MNKEREGAAVLMVTNCSGVHINACNATVLGAADGTDNILYRFESHPLTFSRCLSAKCTACILYKRSTVYPWGGGGPVYRYVSPSLRLYHMWDCKTKLKTCFIYIICIIAVPVPVIPNKDFSSKFTHSTCSRSRQLLIFFSSPLL